MPDLLLALLQLVVLRLQPLVPNPQPLVGLRELGIGTLQLLVLQAQLPVLALEVALTELNRKLNVFALELLFSPVGIGSAPRFDCATECDVASQATRR